MNQITKTALEYDFVTLHIVYDAKINALCESRVIFDQNCGSKILFKRKIKLPAEFNYSKLLFALFDVDPAYFLFRGRISSPDKPSTGDSAEPSES